MLKLTKKYTQMNELLSKHNAERVWVEAENITLAEYGSMRENISGIEISSSNELSSIITQQEWTALQDSGFLRALPCL